MHLRLPNARSFKRSIDCLRDVVHELTFHATRDGLVAHARAGGVLLCARFHGEYTFYPSSFGLSADELARLLRTATPNQAVAMRVEGTDLKFELFTDTCTSRFTIATLDVPTPSLAPAATSEPRCTVQLRTDRLRSMLRDLRHLERVAIEVTTEHLMLYGRTDNSDGEAITSEITTEGAPDVFGVYPVGYLLHFLKSQHVAQMIVMAFHEKNLTLTLSGDATLCLTLDELGGEL